MLLEARDDMTSPSVVSDLLMFDPSLSRSPVAPDDFNIIQSHQTDMRANRQTNRQTDKQTDGQTD